MNKLVFIVGGARSGKSAHAARMAHRYKNVAFIATCQGRDEEMRERIRVHREARPKSWKTYEEPEDLASSLVNMGNTFDCIIIDCLTLLVSNLLLKGEKEKDIVGTMQVVLASLRKKKARIIMVSNEVGLGLVPANALGRKFRDIAGRINQMVAKDSDQVFFCVSGIPVKIK